MTDAEISVRAKPYTLTHLKRRAAMIAAMRKVEAKKIPGDVVECGVWRGGNIIIARLIAPERICWLYDTFAGMTQPGEIDRNRGGASAIDRFKDYASRGEGWCQASVEDVRGCLTAAGVFDESKLRFVVGDVAETLAQPKNIPDRIALLRLDTDWFASTKIELDVLFPRLCAGGILIVDDYGHWQGAREAVDRYFEGKKFDPCWIDYSAIMIEKQ